LDTATVDMHFPVSSSHGIRLDTDCGTGSTGRSMFKNRSKYGPCFQRSSEKGPSLNLPLDSSVLLWRSLGLGRESLSRATRFDAALSTFHEPISPRAVHLSYSFRPGTSCRPPRGGVVPSSAMPNAMIRTVEAPWSTKKFQVIISSPHDSALNAALLCTDAVNKDAHDIRCSPVLSRTSRAPATETMTTRYQDDGAATV
jgi:hypothetical protein